MTLTIDQFICLSDNFAVLLHDDESGATATIDAPDGEAIAQALKRRQWRLTHILLTHHHLDHVGGAALLKRQFPQAAIVGAKADEPRLPPLDVAVAEGDRVTVGGACARVIETPGHTSGHIAYAFEEDGAVFAGDTLFSLGCGRVFEGTMAQMHASLHKLASLPPGARLYCGHEYTKDNARFALAVDPDNPALRARAAEVDRLRAAGAHTLPSTIAAECATNPFLRAQDAGIRRRLGLSQASDVEVFARLREMKNSFS